MRVRGRMARFEMRAHRSFAACRGVKAELDPAGWRALSCWRPHERQVFS